MTRNQFITLACYLGFIAMGISGTLFGSAKDTLAPAFGLPLSSAGIFVAVQFVGAVAGNMLSGWLLNRVNVRLLLISGVSSMGVGWLILAALTPSTPTPALLPVALIATVLYGFGYGLLTISINLAIVILNADRPSLALNTLNMVYSLGALLGPQLVNLALSRGDVRVAFVFSALIMLALNVPYAFASLPPTRSQTAVAAKPIRWLALWPLVMILFSVIGIETGFATWIFTQLTRWVGSTEAIGTLGNSLFYAGQMVGRGGAPLLLRYVSDEVAVLITIAMIGMATVILLTFSQLEWVTLSMTFIVGVGSGPLFPTILGIATRRYPESRGVISGVLVALGVLGAVLIPPLHGIVGGGNNGGLIVTVALAGLAFMLGWYIRAQRATTPAALS